MAGVGGSNAVSLGIPHSTVPRGRSKLRKVCVVGGGKAAPPKEPMRVQVPENTADLRGMRHDEAMEALEQGMEECPRDSVTL